MADDDEGQLPEPTPIDFDELTAQEDRYIEVGEAEDADRAEDVVSDAGLEALLDFLKESRAFDFTGYKRPSLTRRVRHRMRELGVDDFEEYLDLLQLQPDEFTALFNTILINVTSFFRDAEAWDHLRSEILPRVLALREGEQIRVWSAGSATGAEAYSVAMVLHEAMGAGFRERVKIYATDVDEDALAHARQAIYTERELSGLPEGYKETCFEKVGNRYAVIPDLRRSVIFGRNDLTRDAPISRIDILLCRNTLMYFNAETQARVISRLGFALRPDGVLFLGKAEMLLNHATVFDPIDLKHRFFRRRRRQPTENSAAAVAQRREAALVVAENAVQLKNEILLTNPTAQIAVSADGTLAMVNHRASGLLGLSDRDLGRPFQDLEVSYRPVELRSHLSDVIERKAPLYLREVEWRRSSPDPIHMDVQLVPLINGSGAVDGVSVTFTDVTRFRQLRVEVEAANRQLEVAYEELQSTNEELETTNEELQSTVEELETTNEELQSTNEELETMNEELQSANDEMQSANDQLRERTNEITDLNAFMRSILSSFDAAVIVVDTDSVVQVWTPQAYDLWGLRAEETIGQHLFNLDCGLPNEPLHRWLRSVITGARPAITDETIEAVNRRGRHVTLRVSVTTLREASRTSGALVMMAEVPDGTGLDQT